MPKEVVLSLENVCNGELNEEFQSIIPLVMSQLKHGGKASIGITLEIKRIDNTDTMVSVSYKMKHTVPPTVKSSICQVTGDNMLKTEEPIKTEQLKIVNIRGTE